MRSLRKKTSQKLRLRRRSKREDLLTEGGSKGSRPGLTHLYLCRRHLKYQIILTKSKNQFRKCLGASKPELHRKRESTKEDLNLDHGNPG